MKRDYSKDWVFDMECQGAQRLPRGKGRLYFEKKFSKENTDPCEPTENVEPKNRKQLMREIRQAGFYPTQKEFLDMYRLDIQGKSIENHIPKFKRDRKRRRRLRKRIVKNIRKILKTKDVNSFAQTRVVELEVEKEPETNADYMEEYGECYTDMEYFRKKEELERRRAEASKNREQLFVPKYVASKSSSNKVNCRRANMKKDRQKARLEKRTASDTKKERIGPKGGESFFVQ